MIELIRRRMNTNLHVTQLAALLALLKSSQPAAWAARQYVDTFEGGVNHGGWTYEYFDIPDTLETHGGNPGWCLQFFACCDFFAPKAHTKRRRSGRATEPRPSGSDWIR